ncbi:MAG: DUF4279 domain-containing protein [Tepidisphaeraceae bacterium]|jgi:hypothetical protein
MQNEQPTSSITSSLSLEGQEFDPEALSQITGRQPTKVWHQKVDALKGDPKFAQIGWLYRLTKRPHWSIDDAVREILDLFEDRREQILSFVKQHNCSLHLSLRLHGDSTVIIYKIERETLERIANFRCSMSFSVDV